MKNAIFITLTLLFIFSCGNNNMNKQTAESYFNTLAEGKDSVKISQFLSDKYSYNDVIFKQLYDDKAIYISSLSLNNTNFDYNGKKVLVVEEITSENDTIVYVKGTFNAFTYNEKPVAERKFISALTFDSDGKIKKQEDWQDNSLESILDMYKFRNSSGF